MRHPPARPRKSKPRPRCRYLQIVPALLSACVLPQVASAATTDTWTDGTGDWSLAANWTTAASTHAVPAAGDIVNFTETDGVNRTIIYDYTGAAITLNTLTIDLTGGTGTANSTLSMAANTLTATTEVIGNSGGGSNGTGSFNQSGGTNAVNNTLYLGENATDKGFYTLSAGILSIASSEIIGDFGNGTFNQTGGSNSPSNLFVGDNVNSTGNYSFSGNSTLSTSEVEIGVYSTGAFNQNGGTVTISDFMTVGNNAGGNGTYNLSAGVLNSNYINLGYTSASGNISASNGVFNQTGGNATIASGMTIGIQAGTTGLYMLSAGSLAVNAAEYIGNSGTGSFNQSGGNHTLGSGANLYLGETSGGIGNYTLSGNGTLTANANEYVGDSGNGTFVQTGGTHSISNNLALGNNSGANGNYTLSGNGTLIAHTEYVGNTGNGTFNQSAGNNTFSAGLVIGHNSGSTGSYSLSGTGTLATQFAAEYVGESGNGTFHQSGGSNAFGGVLWLGLNPGATGSYTLSAGNLTSTSGFELVGDGGNGTLTQSGGNNTAGNSLYLGVAGGSNGTFALSGGSLNVSGPCYVGGGSASAGGVGTLNISGGNATISGTLKIWSAVSSVNLSGGILNVGALDTLGNPARFNWTAGALIFLNGQTIDSNFTLGPSLTLLPGMTLGASTGQALTNNGSLTLSGGALGGGGTVVNNGLLSGSGNISSSGGLTNADQMIQTSGIFSLTSSSAGFINQGTLAMASGSQFQLAGADASNDGTINLTGGSITGAVQLTNFSDGVIVGPGNISTTFVNQGTLVTPDGTTKVGSFTNNGVVEMAGAAAQLGSGGTITNAAMIEGFGKISDSIDNNGTIQPIGGTLNISGTLTNSASGFLVAGAGNNLLVSSGLAVNAGIISLTGGTFDNGGHPLSNAGTIIGYGTFRTGGTGLTNNANITFTGGTTTLNGNLVNSANQTINFKYQPAIITGNINNSGTIKITGTTVTYTGTLTNNPGSSYNSDPATNIFQANVNSAGTMTGGPGDVYNFSSGSVNNSGSFINGGTLISSDNITNSGSFTQSGTQTWASNTTFSNTGGTATFGSDTGSTATSPLNIIITAGTVNLATTQHLSALTVTTGIAAITAGTTKTNALTVGGSMNNWTGTVSLGQNKLVVESTLGAKASALATLQNEALYGQTHSTGITSAGLAPNLALAVIDNGALATPFTMFGGVSVDTHAILVAPELLGDTNIDGVVNLTDLTTVLHNLGAITPAWTSGNFDHSGTIDLNDLDMVLNNLGTTYANSGSVVYAESLIATADVPEPASLALLLLAAPILFRRSRLARPVVFGGRRESGEGDR